MEKIITLVFISLLISLSFSGIVSIEDNLEKNAKIDLAKYPPDIKALYPLFSQKCSKCHSLSRPLNSGFSRPKFKEYIGKMRRKPNSGINTEDAIKIYTFLGYFSENKK
jgi:hypothetical protein